jgi:hypothetical protein
MCHIHNLEFTIVVNYHKSIENKVGIIFKSEALSKYYIRLSVKHCSYVGLSIIMKAFHKANPLSWIWVCLC